MEGSNDFKKVFLNTDELRILSDARHGSVIQIHPVQVSFLISYGLMEPYAFSETENQFIITSLGKKYLDYVDKLSKEKSKEKRRLKVIEIRSWLALLISLFALFKGCS